MLDWSLTGSPLQLLPASWIAMLGGGWYGMAYDERRKTRELTSTMQRLRIPFTRSKTPSGTELKAQSSLEVPKQIRGSSLSPAPSPQPPARICRSPSPKLERQAALQRADLDPDEEDDDDDWDASRQSSIPSAGLGETSLAARSAPPSRQSSRQISLGTTASQLSRDSAADSADRSWFLGSSSDIGEYTEIWLEVPEMADRPSAGPIRRCASAEPSLSPRHTQSLESGMLLEVNDWPARALHRRKAATGEIEIEAEGGRRTLRSTCDWSEAAVNGEHLWMPTSASGDFCLRARPRLFGKHRSRASSGRYLPHAAHLPGWPLYRSALDGYRPKTGSRMKCTACKIICHTGCIANLIDKVKFACKPTFRMQRIEEQCSLGIHKDIIVPPSWIVKLPRRGSFKSSLRKSPKKRSSSRRKSRDWIDKDQTRAFAIKPIPTANVKPIIVFLNPKSGGNQGAKLMQKFQWLLNPRQVFDLTQGGPREGLEMYRKVPNLRVLACGGDGTVGWVLSVLDQMGFSPPPAIAVLPLGTGNDLARALGWGGGYTDEPISKILCNISEGEEQDLDRWEAIVTKNEDAEPSEEGKDNLPLNVINNYFSLGVDAHIALEFHEAREARPDKFSSRLRNKMFYGQAGGKDLLQRRWKDLSEHVTIVCDDTDITHKLREHKVHAILFLNIPSYGGGTHPWAGRDQSTSDGLMEVIGLTTYQLPLLHAGGHGTSLGQCRKAVITTARTIPMQVDGEACRVNPSIITVSHLNRARMICKRRGEKTVLTDTPQEQLRIRINRITMSDYEQYHYDKETLMQHSMPLGVILVDHDSDLEQVRRHINRMQEENQHTTPLSPEWCFVDSCTAERFFRIDRAQEHLHFVTDISSEDVYVLDPMAVTSQVSATANNKLKERLFGAGASPTRLVRGSSDRSSVCFSHLLERSSEEILHAAQSGDLPRVKELHTSGVSLFSVSAMGQTALHLACSAGHKDVVRYLLANAPASAVNMRDNDKGHTALHCAALHGRRTICSMLVASGALLTLADSDGNTARQLALQADDKDLADYLESQEHFQLVVSDDHETAV
ncbi:Diacylglycerol kinase zeta [Amphibalanus amphitrite]|uniref:Diacylglycerol kinase n=1 Tax=Amphibalanus amphitrite TaxID=1232801 RepID=A0A6A4XAN3_AMPAM|nr:Diacylglycerol kinase zeta [Amphibalanus amphitrite]